VLTLKCVIYRNLEGDHHEKPPLRPFCAVGFDRDRPFREWLLTPGRMGCRSAATSRNTTQLQMGNCSGFVAQRIG